MLRLSPPHFNPPQIPPPTQRLLLLLFAIGIGLAILRILSLSTFSIEPQTIPLISNSPSSPIATPTNPPTTPIPTPTLPPISFELSPNLALPAKEVPIYQLTPSNATSIKNLIVALGFSSADETTPTQETYSNETSRLILKTTPVPNLTLSLQVPLTTPPPSVEMASVSTKTFLQQHNLIPSNLNLKLLASAYAAYHDKDLVLSSYNQANLTFIGYQYILNNMAVFFSPTSLLQTTSLTTGDSTLTTLSVDLPPFSLNPIRQETTLPLSEGLSRLSTQRLDGPVLPNKSPFPLENTPKINSVKIDQVSLVYLFQPDSSTLTPHFHFQGSTLLNDQIYISHFFVPAL